MTKKSSCESRFPSPDDTLLSNRVINGVSSNTQMDYNVGQDVLLKEKIMMETACNNVLKKEYPIYDVVPENKVKDKPNFTKLDILRKMENDILEKMGNEIVNKQMQLAYDQFNKEAWNSLQKKTIDEIKNENSILKKEIEEMDQEKEKLCKRNRDLRIENREIIEKHLVEMDLTDIDGIKALNDDEIQHIGNLILQRHRCILVGDDLREAANNVIKDVKNDAINEKTRSAFQVFNDLKSQYEKADILVSEIQAKISEALLRNKFLNITEKKLDLKDEVVHLPDIVEIKEEEEKLDLVTKDQGDRQAQIEEEPTEEIKTNKNIKVDVKTSTDRAAETYFTNLKAWKDNVNVSKPGLFIKGFIQCDENKNSNFGMDICITSYDMISLCFLVYKFIDMLEGDFYDRDGSMRYKKIVDDIKKELDMAYEQKLKEGYVPSFEKHS